MPKCRGLAARLVGHQILLAGPVAAESLLYEAVFDLGQKTRREGPFRNLFHKVVRLYHLICWIQQIASTSFNARHFFAFGIETEDQRQWLFPKENITIEH